MVVVAHVSDHGISLNSGTSACTIEDNESFLNALPTAREANGIYMFGSPANLLRGNRWHHNQDTGEQIQSGSNDVISIQNVSWANGDHGYDHLLATGSIHVGDVAYGNFRDGFSFEGSASGCSVHDCIAIENGLTTNEIDLWVDDNSFVGFSSDDNIFWNSTAVPLIKRGLVRYPTVQDWSAASGQDTRTFQADPRFADPANGDFHLMAGSPAIDAANTAVASWSALDADGHARVDDPLTPNTGLGPVPYADRGAFEYPASPFSTAGVNPPPAGDGRRLSVFPNPLSGTGEAVFETSRPGALRAGIYDLTGRCVRVLAGGEFAPGGSHRVSFEGTRDDGQRLEPGVYFLRVNGADGPLASRFLLIR